MPKEKIVQTEQDGKIIFESKNIKVILNKVDMNEFSEIMLEIFAKLVIGKYDHEKLKKILQEINVSNN